jgi:hypothetical protein
MEFLVCLFLTWVYWTIAHIKWRSWAFENVRNVHELKRKAIEANLYFHESSFFSKLLWIRDSDKIKLEQLKEKFDHPDEFVDQKNIPSETIVYHSKIRIALVFVSLVFAFFLGLTLLLTAHSLMGIVMASFAGFFGILKYRELTQNTPQIIINDQGMETSLTKFKKWASIDYERVTCLGTGNNRKFFLEYSYPGGNEKFLLNQLSIEPSQLENLLYIYRGRSNPKAAPVEPPLSKEELVKKFFNQ